MAEDRNSELTSARVALSFFTPERPMILHQAQFDAMRAEPELADMMDRVRLIDVMPEICDSERAANRNRA